MDYNVLKVAKINGIIIMKIILERNVLVHVKKLYTLMVQYNNSYQLIHNNVLVNVKINNLLIINKKLLVQQIIHVNQL